MPKAIKSQMSPMDQLHRRLSELAQDCKDAHARMLLDGNREGAAHSWCTYQEASAVRDAIGSMIRQVEDDLIDI